MEENERYCIWPESPYCPACPFSYCDDVIFPDDEPWNCGCTKEMRDQYFKEHPELKE